MVRLRMRPIYIPLSEIHTFASEAALWNGSVRKSHKLAGRIVFPEWVTLPTVWEWILIAAIIHVVLRAGQNNLSQANCREWRFWIAGTPFKSLKRSVPNCPPLKKISIASPTYIVRTSWSFLQLSFTCDVPLAPLPVLLLLFLKIQLGERFHAHTIRSIILSITYGVGIISIFRMGKTKPHCYHS